MADQATTQTAAATGGTTATDDKFKIPEAAMKKYPDLIALIKETESMTDAERTYWFQILPIMTDEQVSKLRAILVKEKEQLTKLDSEYEKELKRINDKHLLEWKELETRKAREERQKAESKDEVADKKAEEDVLAQLNNL